jgi:hypothetical protein
LKELEDNAFQLFFSRYEETSMENEPLPESADPLEQLWDGLLSRQPERVRAAFATLDGASQRITLAHLKRMATESDWHPEQRQSAMAALQALDIKPG